MCSVSKLQQHLPFTVLKLEVDVRYSIYFKAVATALTVYGIETILRRKHRKSLIVPVATALTVYGIETHTKTTDISR